MRLINKLVYLFRLYVLRDAFLINVKKWFRDAGDKTLRLDYDLDKTCIVFDVGGYLGDYTEEVSNKFGCRIFLFEPVPEFYDKCVKRFSNNPSIVCLNYGLSSNTGWFEINLNNNESSFNKIMTKVDTQQVEVRSINEVVAELGIEKIDLIKINIEGGEFDLLPVMIDSGLINRVKYIQVQFHNFIEGAVIKRMRIRDTLNKSHTEMWNYEFIWESWVLR